MELLSDLPERGVSAFLPLTETNEDKGLLEWIVRLLQRTTPSAPFAITDTVATDCQTTYRILSTRLPKSFVAVLIGILRAFGEGVLSSDVLRVSLAKVIRQAPDHLGFGDIPTGDAVERFFGDPLRAFAGLAASQKVFFRHLPESPSEQKFSTSIILTPAQPRLSWGLEPVVLSAKLQGVGMLLLRFDDVSLTDINETLHDLCAAIIQQNDADDRLRCVGVSLPRDGGEVVQLPSFPIPLLVCETFTSLVDIAKCMSGTPIAHCGVAIFRVNMSDIISGRLPSDLVGVVSDFGCQIKGSAELPIPLNHVADASDDVVSSVEAHPKWSSWVRCTVPLESELLG